MADDTRQRIVEAALLTLKRDGLAGTSARSIARTGGFNQALVFYYFGSVNELLLAALDATSDERMARYQAAVDQVATLPDLFQVAADVYREDLANGHITVLAELLTAPELRAEVAARIEPWRRFTENALRRVLGDSPVIEILSPADLAHGIVALYLGLELLTALDGDGDAELGRAESLFAAGQALAAFLGIGGAP